MPGKLLKCFRCEKRKPRDEFYKDQNRTTGRRSECKDCAKAYRKNQWAENPHAQREYSRRSKIKTAYGMSAEEYDAMLLEQGGCCAICRRKPIQKRLSVEQDNPGLMRLAAEYVENHRGE